jgi:hypothetical protein
MYVPSCIYVYMYLYMCIYACIVYIGHHSHPAPPSIRPPPSAMNRFQQQVLNSPSTRPKQLLVGSHYTPSVTSIHPSLSHLDRMAHHRRQLLKIAQTNNSITDILAWQEKNPNFIVASSLNTEDGFIFMQSPTQRELCKDFVGTIQTDALESFVNGPGNMVLCITSGYVERIGRCVPLAFCIILGKTELHYRKHFYYLFQHLNMKLLSGNCR